MNNKLAIMLVLPFLLQAQEKLSVSLDDCLKIGLDKSKTIIISKSKVESSGLKVKEIEAGTLPSLKLSAAYTRLSDIDKPNFGSSLGSFSSMFNPILNNTTLKLSLQQPLFLGNKLTENVKVMENNLKTAEFDLTKDEKQVSLDIKNAYWAFYKAIENKKVVDENIAQIQIHLADQENFFKQGIATNNDLLKVKVQLSNAKLTRIDAENEVQRTMVALNNAIGIDLSTQLELKSLVEYKTDSLSTLGEYISMANTNRPELKGLEYKKKANEASVNVAKSGWYPQVYFTANYTYADPNQRITPQKDAFKGTWDVGVNLSFDIWNWKTTSHQTGQAEATLDQTKQQYLQQKDDIRYDVTQNFLALVKAKEKISVAQESVNQADENYRVVYQKFKNGVSLNSDLIDAEYSLFQAKINYTTAIVDYEINKAKLEKSIAK